MQGCNNISICSVNKNDMKFGKEDATWSLGLNFSKNETGI